MSASDHRSIALSIGAGIALPAWVPAPGVFKTVGPADGLMGTANEAAPALDSVAYGSIARAFVSWNSAAFAPWAGVAGKLLFFGGGHSDYSGNPVLAFDAYTRKWSMLSGPSSGLTTSGNETAWADSKGRYADGKPGVGHTYGVLDAVPPTVTRPAGQLIVPATSYAGWTAAVSHGYAHAFDLATNTWRSAASPSAAIAENGSSCYDSRRDRIWLFGAAGATQYCQLLNPETLAWDAAQLLSGYSAYWRHYIVSCYHPELDVIVQRMTDNGANTLMAVNCTTRERAILTTTGLGPAANEPTGLEYCPADGAIYGYKRTQSQVFRLLPPASGNPLTGTWTWSRIAFGAGSDQPNAFVPLTGEPTTNVHFNQFRYAPAIDSFVWATGRADLPAQFLRRPTV